MSVFRAKSFQNHENVFFCWNAKANLRCIIAIHNTLRGPALGGCRAWAYQSEDEALDDVLRLSHGMSYKAAMADLALGGGKAVILLDSPDVRVTEKQLDAFAYEVEKLQGRYITAEDVGTTAQNMIQVRKITSHVVGLPRAEKGGSGNPGPVTAHGVFKGILAAVKHRLNQDDLSGLRVSIQGLGNVGAVLCELLHEAGCEILVYDINEQACKKAQADFGAQILPSEDLLKAEVDVFAPCALGGILDKDTVQMLKAKIVAGSANNQLANQEQDYQLKERNILYAPDYVINAGGLINASFEGEGYTRESAIKHVDRLADTLLEVFAYAEREDLPTGIAADHIAESRLKKKGI